MGNIAFGYRLAAETGARFNAANVGAFNGLQSVAISPESKEKKIVFTGDIIATQRPDPLIHLEKNDSSEGWITTTKGIVALNADQFVPGHGNVP